MKWYWLTAAALVASVFNHRGIALSDEYLYSFHAWKLSQGAWEWGFTSFQDRLGQVVPMAGFISLLGGNPYVLSAWSLVAAVALVVGAAWALGREYRPVAALLAWNPILLRYSADVSHDLVMTAFATLATLVLLAPGKKGFWQAVFFAGCVSWAWWTKETVVYLLPFWLWIAWKDRHNWFFWGWAGVLLAAAAGIYLAFFYWQTGDAWHHFRVMEAEHGGGRWGYTGEQAYKLPGRVTWKPFAFLLVTPGLTIPLLLSGFWLLKTRFRGLDAVTRFCLIWLGVVLATHIWGSSSLSAYNPLPLSDRMWMLAIPPATILAVKVTPGRWSWIWLAAWIGLQVIQVFSYGRQGPFFRERAFFQKLEQADTSTVVVSDTILVRFPLAHFDFKEPQKVRLLDWNHLPDSLAAGPYYLIYSPERAEVVREVYRRPAPDDPGVWVKKVEY